MDEWLAQRPKVGKYEPFLRLAAGGMGAVYLARQNGAAGFERLVVVKRVHPHLLGESTFLDMVRDEARISSLIRHPNVVPVIDVVDVKRELFLVLEYVESIPLSALIKAHRLGGSGLPLGVVARIMNDVLAGLHAAHEARDLTGKPLGVVHRDVSPHNVLVGSDGVARLIDFGIAKAESRLTVTKSGSLKGKIRYMPPEQIRQQPVDRRADVYSAGVVLFEALTGQHLFTGPDEGAILLRVLTGDVRAPSEVVPGLPSALDEVVMRATSADLEFRYQTAAELQEALEAIAPLSPVREVRALVERHAREGFEKRRAAIEAWFQSPSGVDVVVDEPTISLGLPPVVEENTRAAQPLVMAVTPDTSQLPRATRAWVPIVSVTLATAVGLGAFYFLRAPAPRDSGSSAATATSSAPTVDTKPVPPIVETAPAPVPCASPTPTPTAGIVKKPKPAAPPPPRPDLHKNPYESN